MPDAAVVASRARPRQLSTKKPGLSKENPGFSYLKKKHWAGTEPAANYFLTSSVVVVVVAAGVSVVVVSVDFDSHDDRPAVRAKPRAATLNRLFILGVILKMG